MSDPSSLFSVRCTTCTARLRVRNAAVVGQIVECPRCGSMVLVEPPPGWKAPPADAPSDAQVSSGPKAPAKHSPGTETTTSAERSAATGAPEAKSRQEAPAWGQQAASQESSPRQEAPALAREPVSPAQSAQPSQTKEQPDTTAQCEPAAGVADSQQLASMAEAGLDLTAADGQLPKQQPQSEQQPSADQPATQPEEPNHRPRETSPDGEEPVAETETVPRLGQLKRHGALVAATAAVLALGVAFWFLGTDSGDSAGPLVSDQQSAGKPAAAGQDDSPLDQARPGTGSPQENPWQEIGPWIPRGAQMVFVARFPERGTEAASVEAAVRRWEQQFRYPLARFLEALAIHREAVHWVCWSVTEPKRWDSEALLVVKLREPLGTLTPQVAQAPLTGQTVAGAQVRYASGKKWKWPFVFLGPELLATGAPHLLRMLPAPVPGQMTPVQRVVSASLKSAAAVCWAASQAALEQLAWRLPPAWRNQWPQYEQWQTLRTKAQAVAVALECGGAERLWVRLTGATPSVNLELQNHLVTLGQGLLALLQQQLDTLPEQLQEGRIDAARSQALADCLRPCCQTLESQQVQLEEDHVALSWTLALPLAKGLEALQAQLPWWQKQVRLSGERQAVERLGALAPALAAYEKAEGALPQGAAGSPVLPPQRRLSWIASLLPYLGQEELYRRLSFAHSWNDPVNQPATRRVLWPLVNPLLPRQRTDEGYAVTHFVGVGGWGARSPWADANDPDAGLFAYNHRRRFGRLPGGASQTIAVLSVQDQLGPWSAGGPATVRGVTGLPLAGGPDGFGSGTSQGTLALMADGSVRMLSNRIDPQVLRYLVVVNKTPRPQLLAGLAPPLLGPKGKPASDRQEPGAAKNKPQLETESPSRAQVATNTPDREPSDSSHPGQHEAPVREAPPEEVPPQLQLAVSELDFRQLPLEEVLGLLAQMAGLELQLDVDSLLAAGVSPETKISLQLHRVTLHQALRALAAEWGLRFRVQGKTLHWEALPQRHDAPVTFRYPARWLVQTPLGTPEKVIEVLQRLVAPGTWAPQAEPGRMHYRQGMLVVTHTPAVHRQLGRLLARWQLLRTRPVEARGAATTWQQARPLLEKKVRLSYRIPVSLRHVCAALQKQTGVLVLIDGRSLRAQGLRPEEQITVEAKDVSLWEALQRVVEPLGLALIVEDARTVRITTPQVASSQLRVEIYPLWYRWREAELRRRQVERLQRQIQPESWQPQGAGWGYLEPDSGLWIVSQTQEVHLQLEQALEQQERLFDQRSP